MSCQKADEKFQSLEECSSLTRRSPPAAYSMTMPSCDGIRMASLNCMQHRMRESARPTENSRPPFLRPHYAVVLLPPSHTSTQALAHIHTTLHHQARTGADAACCRICHLPACEAKPDILFRKSSSAAHLDNMRM